MLTASPAKAYNRILRRVQMELDDVAENFTVGKMFAAGSRTSPSIAVALKLVRWSG
jgi:hypothetical protein